MRRFIFFLLLIVAMMSAPLEARPTAEVVLKDWYRLVLLLVRHTPTYSPPVASRSFAYLGVASYEAVASGDKKLVSLGGQLNGLASLPVREKDKPYDDVIVLNAAMAKSLELFFSNTGPSGQNALRARAKKSDLEARRGVPKSVAQRSKVFGEAIAQHIYQWSLLDGGAVVENMGFPLSYQLGTKPGHWLPTNQQGLQQVPLLPNWGKNRTFALPAAHKCEAAVPTEYSEDKQSAFFKEAEEVYAVRKALTPEQKTIARFWSDDPMLSPTPPGHWVSILLQTAERDKLPAAKTTEALARLGIAVADGFIGCWQSKYRYDLLRPVTYIRKHIDPNWEPLLITPPFPEYPSGHSVQSGAAVEVLESLFGKDLAFEDATHAGDGIAARRFANFDAAAKEAAISRLYGGIHFRPAIDNGLIQGRCIGAFAAKLIMHKP
jgi:hypothetical protein